jgi:hypothetical protein
MFKLKKQIQYRPVHSTVCTDSANCEQELLKGDENTRDYLQPSSRPWSRTLLIVTVIVVAITIFSGGIVLGHDIAQTPRTYPAGLLGKFV